MALDNNDRTLFIGNLHNNVTEDVLYELFFQAGPVERVSIIPIKNNYLGYGFITYKHESSVEYALELFKGIRLFKKELNIKKRVPKQSNEVKCADFQDQLHNLQLLAQKLNPNPQINPVNTFDFSFNPPWGNQSNGKKPYNMNSRNHLLRPEERNQRKNRNHGNKDYHGRKGRSRLKITQEKIQRKRKERGDKQYHVRKNRHTD